MVDQTEREVVFRIGVVARMLEIHPQTLRAYERLGLVRPGRSAAGNRLYSPEHLERLRRIQRLTQDLGVNLAGVEIILDLLEKMEMLRRETEREMEEMRRELRRRLERQR
jgi:MerR family transcriptional regulator/heat shock protein HspR